jgi:hypothetical protein
MLQAAYDSSEWELVELRAAALETCQAVEEGEAQAGSLLASRLRALGAFLEANAPRASLGRLEGPRCGAIPL